MNLGSKVRTYMEHNSILRRYVTILKKSRLVRALHHIDISLSRKSKLNEMAQFKNIYEKDKEKFKETYSLLADDESRDTYKAVINFRRTWDYKALEKHVYYPQYFVYEIFDSYKNDIFVDGGAYNGDTIKDILKISKGSIRKIYAWEPDEKNGKSLLKELGKKDEITWIPCAMYRERATLHFSNSGSGVSAVNEAGELLVNADSVDNLCSDATFIKMDIEGAEIDALYGARETIIRNKPKLAICIYHKPEHLYQIPLLIHEWVPEYKLYVRHHSDFAAETVLYAKIS